MGAFAAGCARVEPCGQAAQIGLAINIVSRRQLDDAEPELGRPLERLRAHMLRAPVDPLEETPMHAWRPQCDEKVATIDGRPDHQVGTARVVTRSVSIEPLVVESGDIESVVAQPGESELDIRRAHFRVITADRGDGSPGRGRFVEGDKEPVAEISEVLRSPGKTADFRPVRRRLIRIERPCQLEVEGCLAPQLRGDIADQGSMQICGAAPADRRCQASLDPPRNSRFGEEQKSGSHSGTLSVEPPIL